VLGFRSLKNEEVPETLSEITPPQSSDSIQGMLKISDGRLAAA